MITRGMMTSQTDMWATPQYVFDTLNKRYHFTTDVCATPENAKCGHYFTPEMDGLAQEWTGRCWCNPPYGREVGRWVKKAYESGRDGTVVVCLLPSRTDTKWWHDHVMKAGAIYFVKGRLKFGGGAGSAPFPSAVVVFDGSEERVVDTIDLDTRVRI